MRSLILLLMLIAVSLFLGCIRSGESSPGDATAPSSSSVDQEILFAVCEGCHGADGMGGTGIAPALQGNEWIKQADIEDIEKVIKEGRGFGSKRYEEYASAMPGWKDTFSEEEIALLARYVKSLSR